MKAIRPFVSFNFDLRKKLSRGEKAKISRYYNELQSLLNRPHKVYRPRSAKAKRAAKAYVAGGEKVLPGIKAFPIPSNNPEAAKIKVKGKKLVVDENGFKRTFIPFDPLAVAMMPREYTEELIKDRSEKYYDIVIGLRDSLGTVQKPFVPERIEKIMTQYGKAGDFLRGLYAVSFPAQAEPEDYKREKEKARAEAKKAAKARKRKDAKAKKKNNRS